MRKPKKDISIRKSLCIASRYENRFGQWNET